MIDPPDLASVGEYWGNNRVMMTGITGMSRITVITGIAGITVMTRVIGMTCMTDY